MEQDHIFVSWPCIEQNRLCSHRGAPFFNYFISQVLRPGFGFFFFLISSEDIKMFIVLWGGGFFVCLVFWFGFGELFGVVVGLGFCFTSQ